MLSLPKQRCADDGDRGDADFQATENLRRRRRPAASRRAAVDEKVYYTGSSFGPASSSPTARRAGDGAPPDTTGKGVRMFPGNKGNISCPSPTTAPAAAAGRVRRRREGLLHRGSYTFATATVDPGQEARYGASAGDNPTSARARRCKDGEQGQHRAASPPSAAQGDGAPAPRRAPSSTRRPGDDRASRAAGARARARARLAVSFSARARARARGRARTRAPPRSHKSVKETCRGPSVGISAARGAGPRGVRSPSRRSRGARPAGAPAATSAAASAARKPRPPSARARRRRSAGRARLRRGRGSEE